MNAVDLKGLPVLQGYIGGDESLAMEEKSDDEVLDIVMRNLSAMFPTISKPDKFLITRWGKDEAVRGAYSFATVGQGEFSVDAEILRERAGNNVWFAGEATDSGRWRATNGAWDSGKNAAIKMISALRMK